MNKFKTAGYLNGIVASISYGTNPLFALPMFSRGFGVNSVLFYRYIFAVIIYGLYLKFIKKISFKISTKECLSLFIYGIIFSLSSIFLFLAFQYMDSGLACTILFAYPIIVALISKIFFNERLPKTIILALIITIIGITLLYEKVTDTVSIKGIIYVFLSALSYAIYLVGIKYSKTIKHLKPDKLTFYIMFFGLSVYVWNLRFCTLLQPLNSIYVFGCALALAIFPTIISLETISYAIKFIGPTKTAILGALEPLTAIFVGTLIFKEVLTQRIIIGITLVILGVIISIAGNNKNNK